jgi:hypothetical protein
MDLSRYFESDDGSLPEIDVDFKNQESLHQAFAYFFELGAENNAKNGSYLWLRKELREVPFTGPGDAELVTAGLAGSFHVVLDSIRTDNHILPTLGILVDPASFVIDYRMGTHWSRANIGALLNLLKSQSRFGGSVSVARWWGATAQEDFCHYLGSGA